MSQINSGYFNNINNVTVRAFGNVSDIYTDRAIDFNGDGVNEKLTITHVSGDATGTPSAPGGKIRITTNGNIIGDVTGIAHSRVSRTIEPDGGIEKDFAYFNEGI